MKLVRMAVVYCVVALVIGLSSVQRAEAATPVPDNDCCICVIVSGPQGEDIWACDCNVTSGGHSCLISGVDCTTRGICSRK